MSCAIRSGRPHRFLNWPRGGCGQVRDRPRGWARAHHSCSLCKKELTSREPGNRVLTRSSRRQRCRQARNKNISPGSKKTAMEFERAERTNPFGHSEQKLREREEFILKNKTLHPRLPELWSSWLFDWISTKSEDELKVMMAQKKSKHQSKQSHNEPA
jgi:hypothetical protein